MTKRFFNNLILTLLVTCTTTCPVVRPAGRQRHPSRPISNQFLRKPNQQNSCNPQTTVRLSELAQLMVGSLELQYSSQLEALGEQLKGIRALRDFLLTSNILNPKYDLLFKQIEKQFPEVLNQLTELTEIVNANNIAIVNLATGQLILSRFFETLCQILP